MSRWTWTARAEKPWKWNGVSCWKRHHSLSWQNRGPHILCVKFGLSLWDIRLVTWQRWLCSGGVRKRKLMSDYCHCHLLYCHTLHWITVNVASKHTPSRGGDVGREGDVALLVKRQTGMPPTQVPFPGAAGDVSPRVSFQCRLSYSVCTPLCAVTWIYIRAHGKIL